MVDQVNIELAKQCVESQLDSLSQLCDLDQNTRKAFQDGLLSAVILSFKKISFPSVMGNQTPNDLFKPKIRSDANIILKSSDFNYTEPSENLERYKCPLCLCCVFEPACFPCCGNVYCMVCYNSLINVGMNRCPCCRKDMESPVRAPNEYNNQLSNLGVKCEKCDQSCLRGQYYDHLLKYCQESKTECMYLGCTALVSKVDMELHLQSCTYKHINSMPIIDILNLAALQLR